MTNELPATTVSFQVYARQIGTREWIPQESSDNPDDVIHWAKRNNEDNARKFEPGAGREFIAVKAVTTFESL